MMLCGSSTNRRILPSPDRMRISSAVSSGPMSAASARGTNGPRASKDTSFGSSQIQNSTGMPCLSAILVCRPPLPHEEQDVAEQCLEPESGLVHVHGLVQEVPGHEEVLGGGGCLRADHHVPVLGHVQMAQQVVQVDSAVGHACPQ